MDISAIDTQQPCVRNCCLNNDEICLGCFRSLREICRWSEADTQERRDIMQLAQQRRQMLALKA